MTTDIVARHEPVVLSRAKSATFISVILQNNKNTVQLHFGCTVFFELMGIMLFSFAPARRYPTRGRRCTARSLCRWHLRGWHSKTRGLRHLKNSSPCGRHSQIHREHEIFAVYHNAKRQLFQRRFARAEMIRNVGLRFPNERFRRLRQAAVFLPLQKLQHLRARF